MSELVLAADASEPFDYAVLPAGVSIILGYLGGDTPHIWTAAEISAAERTGRAWCGIWTAPSTGQILTARTGQACGLAAAAYLAELGRPPGLPVFLDIEQRSYHANPAGAFAARNAFRAALAGKGYPRGYAYWPVSAGRDWVANWTYERPATLPQGVIGQQYAGTAADTRFDLSVFDPAIFTVAPTIGGTTMGTLTSDDKAYIVEQLEIVQTNLASALGRYQWDNDAADVAPYANRHLHDQLAQLLATAQNEPPGAVDVAKLAQAVSAALAPVVGAAVADVLAARLAQ